MPADRMMSEAGHSVRTWVLSNLFFVGVQYAATMAYVQLCVSWSWWRFMALVWNPTVWCIVLNQMQTYSQYLYLLNWLYLGATILHQFLVAVERSLSACTSLHKHNEAPKN